MREEGQNFELIVNNALYLFILTFMLINVNKSMIKITPATVEYTENLTIDLGGVTVKLKAIENSHSYDCAVAYIQEEKCIFLGDIHYEDLMPEKPAYYADSHQKLITGLRKFDFDKVLSGHQMLMTNVDLYAQLADVKLV